MNQIEHPFGTNGEKYRNWNYSKPFVIPPDSALVPMKEPAPHEVADYVPSADEIERMQKAEEKRMRKAERKN